MIEIKAPNYRPTNSLHPVVFLAGSIEMGTAENWQKHIVENFRNSDVVFLNPRRDNWDNSIEQSASNPEFAEQVNWELDGLGSSSIVVFY